MWYTGKINYVDITNQNFLIGNILVYPDTTYAHPNGDSYDLIIRFMAQSNNYKIAAITMSRIEFYSDAKLIAFESTETNKDDFEKGYDGRIQQPFYRADIYSFRNLSLKSDKNKPIKLKIRIKIKGKEREKSKEFEFNLKQTGERFGDGCML